MSERERQKQTLLGLTDQLPDSSKKSLHPFSRLPEYKVQSSSTTTNFVVPSVLPFPLEELTVKLPFRFQADKPGIYSTRITLSCGDDMREFEIEVNCMTQSENEKQPATLYMRTSVFTPVQQHIPIVNEVSFERIVLFTLCSFRQTRLKMIGIWLSPYQVTKHFLDPKHFVSKLNRCINIR